MIKNLENKLKFIEFIDKMKDIERAIYLKNGRQETNAEHCYSLAMMVIAFAEDFPNLDIEKCLKYVMIHDLVEIYAWDTVVLDKKMTKSKNVREKKAFQRIKKDYGVVLPEIISLINDYELKVDTESKYVYSLDKIQPVIQIVMEWGESRKKNKCDFEKIKASQYWKQYPEFWLDKILDIYFKKALETNSVYREK